jgi:putative MATE family efflux protein
MGHEGTAIHLMENAPVWRTILRLGLPTMLGMVVQAVYNITDTFFIGMTGDPNLVAGISLAFPLFMITQGIGSMFGVGSASYISRKLGEQDYDEARHTASVTFYLTFIIGAVMSAVMLLCKSDILGVIGTSENTYAPADEYFTVICIFSMVMIQNISLQGMVRSEGASVAAMTGIVVGIIVNIALDPLFILTFKWGAVGAAWATVIGNAISAIYFIRFMVSRKSVLSISLRDIKPNRAMISEILKIGIPAGLTHIVMSIAGMVNNIFAAGYGDFVVAGQGINMRVNSLAFSMVAGLALGFQPFAGYNYGARNYSRLKAGLKITVLYSSGLSVAFSALLFIFGNDIVALFINDAPTVKAGAQLLRAFVIGMPFIGIQMTFMTTFQALGKPIQALIITMGRSCAVFLPLLFILNFYWGFDGYVMTQPVADIITSGISVALSVSLLRTIGRQSEL